MTTPTEREALITRLRDTASKGVSVWGDLQIEAAKEIEILTAERECYASAMDRMLAANAQWEKLRDPDVLHVNLLRGLPAQLSNEQLLHLLGAGAQQVAVPHGWRLVPMTEDDIVTIAHRTASTYAHRSDPTTHSYGFVKHTLVDFVRKIEAHHSRKQEPTEAALKPSKMEWVEVAPQAERNPMTDGNLLDAYNELIFAVGNKYQNESRHETALRYIRKAEAHHGIGKQEPTDWAAS